MKGRMFHRRGSLRAAACVAALALTAIAAPAAAQAKTGTPEPISKADFAKFVNCPIQVANGCTYGETLSGKFKMGSKEVSITNPVILQGGFENFNLVSLTPNPLVAPNYGAEALSATTQPVPGGLTGLSEEIGGPLSATAELAGPVSGIQVTTNPLTSGHGTAVRLPLKVHLENEQLGPNCYIGSDAEPIVLELTDGTTEGAEPISGKIGTPEGHDKGKITEFKNNTLVSNSFAVPAATGCGTSVLDEAAITLLVNTDAGLPSAAGKNTAELTGNLFVTFSTWVQKYDKKLFKEKAKAEKPAKK
jgi:hypothetical protein